MKLNDFLNTSKYLTQHSLSHNNVSHLPALPALASAHHLDLGDNAMISIAWDSFGALADLEELILSNNLLEFSAFLSAPKENVSARGTPNLQSLDLSTNRLEFPTFLTFGGATKLTKLSTLRLAENLLTDNSGLLEIGKLSALSVLDLRANHLETLRNLDLKHLRNLRTLDLSGNRFTVVPAELRFASALEALWLSGNPLGNLEKNK